MTRSIIPPGLKGRSAGPLGDRWGGQEGLEGQEGQCPKPWPFLAFLQETRGRGVTASDGLGWTPP